MRAVPEISYNLSGIMFPRNREVCADTVMLMGTQPVPTHARNKTGSPKAQRNEQELMHVVGDGSKPRGM